MSIRTGLLIAGTLICSTGVLAQVVLGFADWCIIFGGGYDCLWDSYDACESARKSRSNDGVVCVHNPMKK